MAFLTILQRLRLVMIVAGFCLLRWYAICQEPEFTGSPKHFWIDGGMGLSSVGTAAGGMAAFEIDSNLVSLRFVFNEENAPVNIQPAENTWDISLLYGKRFGPDRFFLNVAGGIAFVNGVRRDGLIPTTGTDVQTYEIQRYGTLGFPIGAELCIMPLPFLSIGINSFLNLNSQNSFAGAIIIVGLGRLR